MAYQSLSGGMWGHLGIRSTQAHERSQPPGGAVEMSLAPRQADPQVESGQCVLLVAQPEVGAAQLLPHQATERIVQFVSTLRQNRELAPHDRTGALDAVFENVAA